MLSWLHAHSTFDEPEGFIISYQPFYSVSENVLTTQSVEVFGSNEQNYTLTDLDPQLTYQVSVAASNSEGNSGSISVNAPRMYMYWLSIYLNRNLTRYSSMVEPIARTPLTSIVRTEFRMSKSARLAPLK